MRVTPARRPNPQRHDSVWRPRQAFRRLDIGRNRFHTRAGSNSAMPPSLTASAVAMPWFGGLLM
jgi:hypothetical protein